MRATLFAAILAFTAPPALAQDATQWQGFYGGVAANIISPEFDNTSVAIPLQEGTGLGVYGGYNFSFGRSVVAGAEVGISGPTSFQTSLGSPDFEFDNVVNARLRGGYAIGNALLYGTLGYQQVNFGAAPGISTDGSADGLVYGVGIEMFLADTVSVRLDYTSTHMDPEEGTLIGAPGDTQIDANAVGLGVALHF